MSITGMGSPRVQPVNIQRMEEAALGDGEFMHELIDMFLDDMPQQLESLRTAVDREDSSAAAAAAHRLKGASASVGAESLSALCEQLEHSSREQRVGAVSALFREVDQESERVHQFLSNLRNQPTRE